MWDIFIINIPVTHIAIIIAVIIAAVVSHIEPLLNWGQQKAADNANGKHCGA